ncbi:hypothetical protein [Actinomadura rubrisoli]|uniref:AMP-binding enzyme C-terminal domain-containing protein n=1 Tax=Actinomadura rubrisoli TaxID=2530368 RepID=A0A4R4ZU98_9ACTN|nr:hypothetical protein [Actinomadura rubrisoli]TDD62415.1 hypothetical protein E1298_44720 [Actinomadura rubrisoli]
MLLVICCIGPRGGIWTRWLWSAGTAEDVHAHARARLAGYEWPEYVVLAEGLPKDPSGKILKRDLRGWYSGLVG